jgi:HlyD family secretion protein
VNEKPDIPAPDSEMISRLGLGKMRRHWGRKHWIFAGIGIVVLFMLLHWAFAGGDGVKYVTQPVTHGPLAITVSATGTLAPRDQVDVGAEVSGRLDAVNVDFNDPVKKGEVLAQINTDQLRAQLSQAQASLAQAKATVIQDAQTLKRYRVLVQHKAISPQTLDTAIANLARARASVKLAEAQAEQFKTQIAKATIRSPINGVVLDRKVEVGQTVAATFQTPVLFTLASDLAEMELDVDIDEADVGQVRAGQTATFTVDAYPARTFRAKLVSVHNAPKTVNGVVTYQGVLMLANPDGVLKPGMTATAEIRAADIKDALLVPNGALRFTPPKQVADKAKKPPAPQSGVNWGRVWVVRDGEAVAEDVKLGASNGRETQILSGNIKPGERVATDIVTPGGKDKQS